MLSHNPTFRPFSAMYPLTHCIVLHSLMRHLPHVASGISRLLSRPYDGPLHPGRIRNHCDPVPPPPLPHYHHRLHLLSSLTFSVFSQIHPMLPMPADIHAILGSHPSRVRSVLCPSPIVSTVRFGSA